MKKEGGQEGKSHDDIVRDFLHAFEDDPVRAVYAIRDYAKSAGTKVPVKKTVSNSDALVPS